MNPIWWDGYNAGLVNERACPYSMLQMFSYMTWHAGNDVGVRIHCAVVEAVYMSAAA